MSKETTPSAATRRLKKQTTSATWAQCTLHIHSWGGGHLGSPAVPFTFFFFLGGGGGGFWVRLQSNRQKWLPLLDIAPGPPRLFGQPFADTPQSQDVCGLGLIGFRGLGV